MCPVTQSILLILSVCDCFLKQTKTQGENNKSFGHSFAVLFLLKRILAFLTNDKPTDSITFIFGFPQTDSGVILVWCETIGAYVNTINPSR